MTPRIRIKVVPHGLLAEHEIRLAAPLREIATFLAEAVRARQASGQGATSINAPLKESKGRVWVSPKKPQPQAEKYRVKHGPFKGWAVYPSVAVLNGLLGAPAPGEPREYAKTHELWDKHFRVYQVSPNHVRNYFWGTHKGSGLRASALARIIQRGSPGILEPTVEELETAQTMWLESVTDQLRATLDVANRSFQFRKRAVSTTRAITKIRSGKVSKRRVRR